jgi:2-polyprenyl-3-methyl-5-hydroxy-6-metoxy-1,4-benzoquinol methylase
VFREAVGGPGLRVLDIGCRYGALTRAYVEGNEVVGIDVDREALEEAARELGIETHWADVDQGLEFPDESFDVVVAGEVLEHVRDPARLAAEALRVLRPGGTFVASVPNSYRLKNRVRFALGRKPETDPTHLHMFTPGDARELLRGFVRPDVDYVVGRFVRVHPRLMGNNILFRGVKPG